MEPQAARELQARMFLAGLFAILGTIYFYNEAHWGFWDPAVWRWLNSLGMALPVGMVGFYLTPGQFYARLPAHKPALRNPANLIVYEGRGLGSCCLYLSCFGCLSWVAAVVVSWLWNFIESLWRDGFWLLLGTLAVGFWVGWLRRHWLEIDRKNNKLYHHLTVGGLQASWPDPAGRSLKSLAVGHFSPKQRVQQFFTILIFSDGSVKSLDDVKDMGRCHRYTRQLSLAYQVPYLKEPVNKLDAAKIGGSTQRALHSDWGSTPFPKTPPQTYGCLPPIE